MYIHRVNRYKRGTLMTLSLILFLVSSLELYNILTISKFHISKEENQILGTVVPGLPVRLTIPAIKINAYVQYLGVNSKGEMDVPDNSYDVGWFELGSRPGEMGSAVIAGHLDGKSGEAGVFADLDRLKPGDKIYIEDDGGRSIVFTVRESRTYVPGFANEIFSANDGKHLNLITCDGVWNNSKKSYSKRLVVFADEDN